MIFGGRNDNRKRKKQLEGKRMKKHTTDSSYREKLIEHLFVGDLLKLSWMERDGFLEISKPEVDNSGYDLIIEANGFLRHIQLKSSYKGARASQQKVHISLSEKKSGCVVWVIFDERSLKLNSFLFFGGKPGEKLPEIKDMKIVKHGKGNAEGYKIKRPNLRIVNKGRFDKIGNIENLYDALFGKDK